ncbi:putative transketolase [Gluconacetobacter diazotrophicus PA1 5]|uniref:Putative transketolase n=2 Tax=Gluconacetobacter diazotrophicus TaxID=33996 RepID=A9HM28_GLUDA|nr:putative transketolase [Gluconacetobacter diazotrophicus PA1 5]
MRACACGPPATILNHRSMARARTPMPDLDDDPAAEAGPGMAPADPDARNMVHALGDAVRGFIGAAVDDAEAACRAAAMAVPACVLWNQFLRFDPACPDWPDRDRFVVSSTRHRPLRNALMRLAGQVTSPGEAVMEYGAHPAVEMAFGPGGQGLGAAIGMALAERRMAARFGRSIVNHRIWVLSCGTELSTGVAMEAASLAARMGLDRITVLFEIPPQDESEAEDTLARYAATGWSVRKVAADDPDAVHAALSAATRSRKPCVVACSIAPPPNAAAAPGENAPRDLPALQDLSTLLWPRVARRGASARRAWLRRLAKHRQRGEFDRVTAGRLPSFWREDWARSWQVGTGAPPPGPGHGSDPAPYEQGTLGYGRRGLDILRGLVPEMLCLASRRGGELTGPIRPDDAAAGDCGTRVHGLAALLNGIALHGGLIPCGATTFVAVDRMRPALRFAAMMRRRVIYLLTDDGLALGQDGAGWLPVEQLASLRAMPNVAVFRPADRRETTECWELALHRADGPSLIALCPVSAGQAEFPDLRGRRSRGASAHGGYVMEEARGPRQVTLVATGSEVAIARQAQQLLVRDGIHAALVSLPCWELFDRQDASYREQVLGSAPRIGIEAASGFGWDRWLGPRGAFIGMEDFGETAPSSELYRRLGITAERIHQTAIHLISETGRDFHAPSGQKAEGGRGRYAAGGTVQLRPTFRNG